MYCIPRQSPRGLLHPMKDNTFVTAYMTKVFTLFAGVKENKASLLFLTSLSNLQLDSSLQSSLKQDHFPELIMA